MDNYALQKAFRDIENQLSKLDRLTINGWQSAAA